MVCFDTVTLDCAVTSAGRIARETSAAGTVSYRPLIHLRDHLGSVRSVIDGDTGTVVETSDYYPLGKRIPISTDPEHAEGSQHTVEPTVISASSTSSPNRWLFSGKESQSILNASIPLLDFGARMYNPAIARWTAADPLSEKYYGISPYSFCHSSPINFIDINGAADFWHNGKIIGNDAKNDNKVYVVKTFETYFYNGETRIPGSGISKKEITATVRFIKKNSGYAKAFQESNIAYSNSIQIESSESNREQMVSIISKDNGKGGEPTSNNMEYGGYISNGNVVEVESGLLSNPKTQSMATIMLPSDKSTFHSHPSGTIIENRSSSTNTINVKTAQIIYSFSQCPSTIDINNAGQFTHYVFGRSDSNVYVYTSAGIQAVIPLKYFVKPKQR